MPTQCTDKKIEFKGLPGRDVEGRFNAGRITSDAGGLLLREVALEMDLFERVAGCFTDYRDAGRVEHALEELVAQRVYGLALGYEDLNDHDELRGDPLLATLVGKTDPSGQDRARERDVGKALAGKSTLNRLEWAPEEAALTSRYHQMTISMEEFEQLFARLFVEELAEPEEPIVLDLDATDDPLHGKQEGRFFHGYYNCYCYLPLYIFCGEELLCAKLRRSNIDASADSLPLVERIVEAIRQKWPEAEIILRADSGFARDRIMTWCEANEVDYVFGLAKNERLKARIEELLEEVKAEAEEKEEPVRRFTEFAYSTLESWSRKRRVVAKAEHLARSRPGRPGKSNPRFVVTSLAKEDYEAKELYEELYCARGEMENRIKEKQLGLFADRTSAQEMRVNQVRLWLSSLAYVLVSRLRRWGLRGTKWAKLQTRTLRAKLFKIGALVSVSVRRVYLRMTSHYPYQQLFWKVRTNLQRAGP